MGLSCGWCFLKKCKKPETNKLNGSLHSLQSFRDQISSDPRVDINTATKEQLQTLPGVTHEVAHAIVEHRTKIGKFKSINDLVVVVGFGGTKSLDLLRPEIKVIENIRRPTKPIPRNPRVAGMLRIAYFPLGDHFTEEYCGNVGVKEIICSFLLRQSIDVIFFCGKHLGDIHVAFTAVINELNEPNLPRVSLTPDRGTWKTLLVEPTVAPSANNSGVTTPSTNQNSETQSLLQSASPSLASHNNHLSSSVISAFNSVNVNIENADNGLSMHVQEQSNMLSQYYSIAFRPCKKPDILISPKLTKGYSDSGAVKVRTDIKFYISQKYETNPENLRSQFIPAGWETHQRITNLKPEYLEVQFN